MFLTARSRSNFWTSRYVGGLGIGILTGIVSVYIYYNGDNFTNGDYSSFFLRLDLHKFEMSSTVAQA